MMNQLIPLLANAFPQETKPGVSARNLYEVLGLNAAAWARWAKKNILENPYALEHEDWECFQHDVVNRVDTSAGGRPTQDYVLSLDFAKKLAMMARSQKGEEIRDYFLVCEQAMQAKNIPRRALTNAEMLLEQAKINVELEQRLLASEATQRKQQATQIEHAEALAALQAQRPPKGKQTCTEWIRTQGHARLSTPIFEAFRDHARRLEKAERWTGPGRTFPEYFYTLATLDMAYKLATRQLALLPGGNDLTHDPGIPYTIRKKTHQR